MSWESRVRELESELRRVERERDSIRGYCDAVRSAITDDGRPPLEASGLKLYERLEAVAASLNRVSVKKGSRPR